jgi:chromate reductase
MMNRRPKILAFAGSLRRASLNKRVLKTAIRGAERAGAEVTYIELGDYPMPIYNSDDQERGGFDENALKLQGLLTEHDGLLIASPEYNGSLPAALKNAIDWASRQSDTYERSKVFPGKVAAMMTASPGSLGGVRSLAHLRGVLTSVGVIVLPQEIAVTFAEDKFAGEGWEMTDERTRGNLEALGAALVEMLRRTHGHD